MEVRLDQDLLQLAVLQELAVLLHLEAQLDLEQVHQEVAAVLPHLEAQLDQEQARLEVAAPPHSAVKQDLRRELPVAGVLPRLAVPLVQLVQHKEEQALLALLQVHKADLAARGLEQRRLPVAEPRCRRLTPSKQMSRPHNPDSIL